VIILLLLLFLILCDVSNTESCAAGNFWNDLYNGLLVRYQFNGDLIDSAGNSRTLSVTAGAVGYTNAIIREGSTAIMLDGADNLNVNIGTTLNIQVIPIISYHVHNKSELVCL
jgi:hypothetical protein